MNKIQISITEEELEELKEGKIFNWQFGETKVKLFKGDEE